MELEWHIITYYVCFLEIELQWFQETGIYAVIQMKKSAQRDANTACWL